MSEVNNDQAALLFLHAQTALHPGSGTALGVVDLPVQRERHTEWPVIPGSSLKGVLRACCRRGTNSDSEQDADANDELVAAFGPPTNDADKHAGAISVTDARLLAFPVRSLRGVFAWVTCPAVLNRLQRDILLAEMNSIDSVDLPSENEALCSSTSPLLLDGDRLILEEFEFERIGEAATIVDWIATRAIGHPGTQARLKNQLVILSDNDFTHFVRHATEVVARVGLDYERKTVKSGALFYQEFLPAETLFYAVVLATASRREQFIRPSEDMLGYLRANLERKRILQIGGDETTGKGLCTVRLLEGKGD